MDITRVRYLVPGKYCTREMYFNNLTSAPMLEIIFINFDTGILISCLIAQTDRTHITNNFVRHIKHYYGLPRVLCYKTLSGSNKCDISWQKNVSKNAQKMVKPWSKNVTASPSSRNKGEGLNYSKI